MYPKKNICGKVLEPRAIAAERCAAEICAAEICAANNYAADAFCGTILYFVNLIFGMLRCDYPNERGYTWHNKQAIELAA